MKRLTASHEFRASQLIYGCLLLAYPRAHRAEYGEAMAQLFRDQCRDAWGESGYWGLVKLWIRILPDLVNTSILERISALKKRKSMSEKLANLSGFRASSVATFVGVFTTVFLLVLITSTAITFILPEVYASTARIKVAPDTSAANNQSAANDPHFIQTTFEAIQSEAVLKPAIDQLNLNVEWGRKYYNGDVLKSAETMAMLKQRVQLAPVKNTMLIAITAYSDDPREAAQIANAIAESYRNLRQDEVRKLSSAKATPQGSGAMIISDPLPTIVDVAEPGHAPVKPNKPLNIALGAVLGFFLALASAGAVALLSAAVGKRMRKTIGSA